MATKKQQDFDADALAPSVEQHSKDISDLTIRVDSVEQRLKPEGMAALLEAAVYDSKKLDKLFSRMFCDMLNRDDDVQTAMASHILKTDRAATSVFVKRAGFAGWSALIFLLGLLVEALVRHYLG